jgi:hypothetical protein
MPIRAGTEQYLGSVIQFFVTCHIFMLSLLNSIGGTMSKKHMLGGKPRFSQNLLYILMEFLRSFNTKAFQLY